jgi:hypothetical protein
MVSVQMDSRGTASREGPHIFLDILGENVYKRLNPEHFMFFVTEGNKIVTCFYLIFAMGLVAL